MKNKKVLKITLLVFAVMITSIVTVFAERIIESNKVTYSNGTSGLSSTNVQGAVDELYAKCVTGNATFNFVKFLQAMEPSDTVIADDGTTDHNMRYTGKEPNNYVTFNGELWRVIGTFNNIDNGNGTKETRIKIIKAESIGSKQWHTNKVNIWKSAKLNTDLQALSYASNSMVENAVWHLGDPGGDYEYTAIQAYEKERGTTVSSGNDPTWTGKVALMYPSDYGFASSVCKDGTQTLRSYNNATCTSSNWLFLGSHEWLLSPYSDHPVRVRHLHSYGHVFEWNFDDADNTHEVRPTVYLKSSVICKNCMASNAGTQSNPFKIA